METRDALLAHLKANGITAVFHYVPLHSSPMGRTFGYSEGDLPITEEVSACLLRLPMYYEISEEDQLRVVRQIQIFCETRSARRTAGVNGHHKPATTSNVP